MVGGQSQQRGGLCDHGKASRGTVWPIQGGWGWGKYLGSLWQVSRKSLASVGERSH